LRRLYNELDRKTMEALDRFLALQLKGPGQSDADFEALKQQARDRGHVMVTIRGSAGEFLSARSPDVLSADYLPHRLLNVTFDNTSALQADNISLPNRLNVRLDFSEPPGFMVYDPWNQPTPNNSLIDVYGIDETWVSATFHAAANFFDNRKRRRRWLHLPATFNILNWIAGIPAALWTAFRLDGWLIASLDLPSGLRAAADIYVVLLGMLAYRVLFYTVRWMFPLIELHGARSLAFRRVLGAVVASLVLALLYDVLKVALLR
jgi:hypothetical protein